MDEEIRLQGAPLSKGIAIGVPFFLHAPIIEENIPEFSIAVSEIDNEIDRYRRALFSSRKDLEELQNNLVKEGSSEAVGIIDTHIQMLDDPMMTVHMEERIRQTHQNTEAVFHSVIRDYQKRFSKHTDAVFQERLTDVMDLSKRILNHLNHVKKTPIQDIPPNSIVFAKEIVPSDTAAAQASRVMAIVTQIGGGTSHAALIARAKGIPFVASIDVKLIQDIKGKCIIVDGVSGDVIINPTPETLAKYRKLKSRLQAKEKLLQKNSNFCAKTIDGYSVQVMANVGSMHDLDLLDKHKASGIGLVRTEYFFLQDSHFLLSEKEQCASYEKCIEKAAGLPVIIRVFDFGGDKFPDLFFSKEKEANPFLGCRGIRFLLKNKEILKIQLRAILRASVKGDVRILLPLVADITEIREIKKVLGEVTKELSLQNEPYKLVPMGCMVEVPSAAMMADILAKEVDFFSIGTNDLMQYTLAIDRSNPSIEYLHSPIHPSLLRMIKMLIVEAKFQNKPVSICGEIASNPLFVPLLLGLGIRCFSCPPRYISVVKQMIRKCYVIEAYQAAQDALAFGTSEEIYGFLKEKYARIVPDEF